MMGVITVRLLHWVLRVVERIELSQSGTVVSSKVRVAVLRVRVLRKGDTHQAHQESQCQFHLRNKQMNQI